jgi:hypothetical protein
MRLFLLAAVLVLLGLPSQADSAGTYGDVTVTTTLSPTMNELSVTLSTTNDQGQTVTSGPHVVNADPNGDGRDVQTSPEITLDGDTYRWRNGKFQKKNGNRWTTIPKKKPGKKGGTQMDYLRVGDPAPYPGVLTSPSGGLSVPLLTNDIAPFEGYFGPGDTTTSLPVVVP